MSATLTTCNLSNLNEYVPSASKPWTIQKINHLYRRVAFGIKASEISEALLKTPVEIIDNLISDAVNKGSDIPPEWAFWETDDYLSNESAAQSFYRREQTDILTSDMFENNLRDRMTLFWRNHLVAGHIDDSASHTYQYFSVLQAHAVGNFKELTKLIGTTTAMLNYLNGNENTKDSPNENYARELYELFTLGVDNGYTQADIEGTARALTGYTQRDRSGYWDNVSFDPEQFDDGEKTIFGITDNFNYDGVIDNLFEQRPNEIAKHICTKIYKYFVNPVVDELIVDQLAVLFIENDFEIKPVLEKLFKSEHFFDEGCFGVVIKSPLDLFISAIKEFDLIFWEAFNLVYRVKITCAELGQNIASPIDVAGWQGDTDWIDSNTLTARWEALSYLFYRSYLRYPDTFRDFVKNVIGGNSNNVETVSKTLVDYFMSKELVDTIEYDQALVIFKDDVPINYFEDGTWNLDWESVPKQVYSLIVYINRIPEFQLK